jgi:hypothetical protein
MSGHAPSGSRDKGRIKAHTMQIIWESQWEGCRSGQNQTHQIASADRTHHMICIADLGSDRFEHIERHERQGQYPLLFSQDDKESRVMTMVVRKLTHMRVRL